MEEDNNSTISSCCSSAESVPRDSLTEEELEHLIQLFKKDISRNYGLFISLNARKNKKPKHKTQKIVNTKCHIDQQHNNNINLTVNNNKKHKIPFDIPKYTNQYIGRQKELQKLDKIIQKNQRAIISGIKGIGKTEFTKYYVEKYFEKFEGNIEWMNGSTKEKLDQSASYLADKHCITPKDLIQYYQDKNALIIIDNAYDKIQYKTYFARSANVTILITTEYPDLNNKKCLYSLPALSDDEAVDIFQLIFQESFQRSAEYDWQELAKYFGNIPLALVLIGGCLHQEMLQKSNLTVEEYLKELQHKKEHLILQNPLPKQYNKIYLSLRLTIEKIITSEKHPLHILNILNVCVYLDDDYINNQVLYAHENIKKSKDKLNNILNTLKKYKLVTVEIKQNHNEVHIHSLIREILLLQQKQDGTSYTYFVMALGLIGSMGVYNIKYLLNLADDFIHILVEFILKNNLLNLLDIIVSNGNDKILDYLLQSSLDPKSLIDKHDLLSKAIDLQQLETVKVLVKNQADVNLLTAKLRSPLHRASKACCKAIIICLLLAGAKSNATDYKKNNPLHTLVGIGYKTIKDEEQVIQCSKTLLNHGALINAKNIEGNTALHIALENKAFKLALYLLSQTPINVKVYNLNKESLLHKVLDWDITNDKEELQALKVIKTLLQKGADMHVIDYQGRNLLLWAIDNKCQRITQFLIEDYSYNVDYQDVNGYTGLHKLLNQTIPTKKDAQITIALVKILLDHKAKTDIEDNDGFIAYDLSEIYGNVKLCLYVQFLKRDLKDKKQKVYYLPDKNLSKPVKRSSTHPPFRSPIRIINRTTPQLNYVSSNGFVFTQSLTTWNAVPSTLSGPTYCNNLLN